MMCTNKVRGLQGLAGAVGAALAASVAMADTDLALEEVVVTAQRRAENIQDVPIAVSAFTTADLDKLSSATMEQVARNTPNLFFYQTDTIKSSRTSIRGITAIGTTAGADPSVAYYVDEVYLGGSVGSNVDLYDVERVEVLRGPQGTLFGRNSTGGVISVTSARPTDEFDAYVDEQFGNYSLQRIKGTVSGPLVDGKLSGLISGLYYDRDGYLDNVYLGKDTNNAHQWGGRAALLFTPTDRIELLLSVDNYRVNQTAQSQETYANNPDSLLGSYGLLVNQNCCDRKVYSGFLGKETLDTWGASLNARIRFDSFDLVSVTGWRGHDYYVEGESDQLPFGIGRNFDPEKVHLFTQELRFESTGSGAWRWLAGLYFYGQNSINDGGIMIEYDLLNLYGAGFLAPVFGGSRGEIDARSFAPFATVTYRFNDKFDLSVGGRYTWDKKDFKWQQVDLEWLFGDPILGGTGSAEGNDSWSKFTPAATASYRFSDDVMSYATFSTGFKGGGYNDGSGVPAQAAESYKPETLYNYELGLKSQWFDRRLLANVSLFYMDWQDIQLRADDASTPNSFDPRITNAGSAHSYGAELEARALVTEHVTLGGNFAYLSTGYDEGTMPTAPGDPTVQLDHFVKAPEYSGTVYAEYAATLPGAVNLTLRGEYQSQSSVYLNIDPRDPFSKEPSYGLWNARATLAQDMGDSGRWSVSLWGLNLTNECYRVAEFDLYNNPLVAQNFAILGSPRTYGVQVRFDY